MVSRSLVHVNPSRSAQAALLRTSESELFHPGLVVLLEGVRRTGFCEKAENLPSIYGLHGSLQIMIPGQHHPHGVRRDLTNKRKELNAIDVRHATIRYHHGKRALNAEHREPPRPS